MGHITLWLSIRNPRISVLSIEASIMVSGSWWDQVYKKAAVGLRGGSVLGAVFRRLPALNPRLKLLRGSDDLHGALEAGPLKL